jgi:hypothetical protein
MEAGKFEISPAAHVADAFKPGSTFSLDEPVGDFDRIAFEKAYAAAIVERLVAHEYADIDVDHDAGGFSVIAFNPDGSNVRLGLSVNDRLGLDIDYADGVSVQNGNEVDFMDGVWEFPSNLGYDALEQFFDYFKTW